MTFPNLNIIHHLKSIPPTHAGALPGKRSNEHPPQEWRPRCGGRRWTPSGRPSLRSAWGSSPRRPTRGSKSGSGTVWNLHRALCSTRRRGSGDRCTTVTSFPPKRKKQQAILHLHVGVCLCGEKGVPGRPVAPLHSVVQRGFPTGVL